MVFSYDKVLNFEGETGPYVQYTNARCVSVLEKVGQINYDNADFAGVDNPESENVVALLGKFTDTLRECVKRNEPCFLSRYLVKLCQEFNRFYLAHRISGEAEGIKTSRAMLTQSVHYVLEEGLRLLGISAPQKM